MTLLVDIEHHLFLLKMPIGFNTLSLGDKLRTAEDQVTFLQNAGILMKEYNCSDCGVVCKELHKKKGTNYFFFYCSGCKSQIGIRWMKIYDCFMFMLLFSFRTGSILSAKHIMLRTFVLLVYFFAAEPSKSHEQLIHEINVGYEDCYQLSTGTKTSTATTVFYHQIFRFSLVIEETVFLNCFCFGQRCNCWTDVPVKPGLHDWWTWLDCRNRRVNVWYVNELKMDVNQLLDRKKEV